MTSKLLSWPFGRSSTNGSPWTRIFTGSTTDLDNVAGVPTIGRFVGGAD